MGDQVPTAEENAELLYKCQRKWWHTCSLTDSWLFRIEEQFISQNEIRGLEGPSPSLKPSLPAEGLLSSLQGWHRWWKI